MEIDVHHLVLGEFLKVTFDMASSAQKAVIAVGGRASFVNAYAMDVLMPEEIARCVRYLQKSDVVDGENAVNFGLDDAAISLHVRSIMSRNFVLGRVAHVSLTGHSRIANPRTSIDNEIDCSIEKMIRRQISHALRQTGGNRVKAAKLLGISRSSLYRKIAHFNLVV